MAMDIPGWTTPPKIEDIQPDRPMGWELLSEDDKHLSDRLSQGRKYMEAVGAIATTTANRNLILSILFFILEGQRIVALVQAWVMK